MCWQLVACVPKRISRGRQYMALDSRCMCWANAHRAPPHPCGLVVCRRTWPPKSRLFVKGVACAYVRSRHIRMVPDHPDSLLPCNARAVPKQAVPLESPCAIRGVARGCQFTAGPEGARRAY
ncbi:hypothetical protein T440DRAFT_127761 [Plenodomus tracheiphilus IPT5]|uniref:Uncharacterized protein n=1 Tax=Plenodomus tracheiphilus IPT5 TaxID=1408161 RepID=A0A6A7B2T7_9PLEO|nr:hypothetical protein T440DRAFT_127761 [Plenodomus tracheiphilus IPT5]